MIAEKKRQGFRIPPAVTVVAASVTSEEAEFLQLYRQQTARGKVAALNMMVRLSTGVGMVEATRLFALDTGQDVDEVLTLVSGLLPCAPHGGCS